MYSLFFYDGSEHLQFVGFLKLYNLDEKKNISLSLETVGQSN